MALHVQETGEVLHAHEALPYELAVQAVMRKSLSDAAAAACVLPLPSCAGTDTSPDGRPRHTEEDMLSAAGEGGGLRRICSRCRRVHGRAAGTRCRADVRREPSGLAPRFTVNKLVLAPTGADVPHHIGGGKALNVGPAFSLKCT